MNASTMDLSIFRRFSFANKPVGVKFLFQKPSDIVRLDGELAFCEMLAKAQQSDSPFYADIDSHACKPAAYLFGYDIPNELESGMFGAALGIFDEPRAAQKAYKHIPRLNKGIVNYVVFAPMNAISFDPDLFLILTDNIDQTEILLRAVSYSTGVPYTSKMTSIMGCGILFLYSYLTGEVNYLTTGLGFGMKVRKALPPGRQIITIPYNCLPTVVQNLEKMTWLLPAYTDQGEEAVRQVGAKLGFTGL